ncbi:hypothetical protein ACWL9T_003581 [Acinetobacter baumannii]|uniref:Uncharacterized protein n=5 Tax=Acinetobacter baumannii TaxID=470 RepID=A0AAD2U6R7_ACIBA|nr:hypothetical protein [Acinetobacter baumannii]EHZ6762914.1 hypothetical protein [Acinetobacter baumannii]EHZ6835130.1 hypothetical protein [Acinetobacter baumannii]EHZ7477059.1 hypothetical protein [Acinetobacter baumannii]EHZ7940466.1 hypothetical protein [Acinetobacter baumannii]EHZ8847574.1 hypothetical protein [Acinetobacter baumannii]
MNSKFQNQPDHKQMQQVQSFYEPALRVLGHLFEVKKQNLRNKGYDENNAAVTKVEFSEAMARQFRITQWLAQQIVTSLTKACLVDSFGGYVKPKGGEK